MTIKGIIFDKDGTLFDFHATWAVWSHGFITAEAGGDPVLGGRLADLLGFDMITRQFRPDAVIIAHTNDEIALQLLPVMPGDTLASLTARMNARAETAPQAPAAPLVPLLAGLKDAGLKLGLATNDAEGPARAHLAAAGIAQMFDFIAGYDSGHGGKPAPGQLLAFARGQGLAPADCAMVGDSLHDLAAGRAAGMATVGVLTGVARRAELEQLADVVLPSIAELPDWLARQNPKPTPKVADGPA